jgi:CBS domain-containing protein
VHRDAPLALAARKMERHHVHRLVVVADDDETLPIGVISGSDVVRAMTAPAPDVAPPDDALPPPGVSPPAPDAALPPPDVSPQAPEGPEAPGA